MGLTSAEGQSQSALNETTNNIVYEYQYHENLVNPICSKVMLELYHTQALYVHSMIYMVSYV